MQEIPVNSSSRNGDTAGPRSERRRGRSLVLHETEDPRGAGGYEGLISTVSKVSANGVSTMVDTALEILAELWDSTT